MKSAVATIFICASLTSVLALPAQVTQQFIVVVHPDNPIGWISAEDLSDIFLTKKTEWIDGVPTMPVDLKDDSRTRGNFSDIIHKKSIKAVESYITQQIFSGHVKPPLIVGTDTEVISFVSSNRGAVGYVSSGADLSLVRKFPIAISPSRIFEVKPDYPANAQRMKIHGNVVLEVFINAQGEVANTTVIERLPMGLTEAANDAVMKWRYQPATLGGEPVETTIRVTLKF